MATGQGILDRLKSAKERPAAKAGVLPLVAFYGREADREERRNRMYAAVERMMAFREDDFPERMGGGKTAHWTLVDLKDAIAVVNANSSPLEFMVSRGEMETREDVDGMGGVRFHTALRLRDLIDGTQVKGIKSPSLSGGGGGGAVADIRGYQMDCIKLLAKVKGQMPASWMFPMLESMVYLDNWFDLWPEPDCPPSKREAKRKQRRKTILALHYALDSASLSMGYMGSNEFRQRWEAGAPSQPPAARRHTQASTASNQLALLTSRAARRR